MHGDRHHRRPFRAFTHELVKPHRQRVQKITGASKAGSHEEATVVVRLRVRDDEELSPQALGVKGNVVGGAVRVVDEAAFLDEKLARVLARPAAAVPAERALTEDSLIRGDRSLKVFALLVSREPPQFDPAPAVA